MYVSVISLEPEVIMRVSDIRITLPITSEVTLTDSGKMKWYQNRTKHDNDRTAFCGTLCSGNGVPLVNKSLKLKKISISLSQMQRYT